MPHRFSIRRQLLRATAATAIALGLAPLVPAAEAPADLTALVKEFAFRDKPKLARDTEFKIEPYPIEGIRALDLQIVLARYLAPDGSEFNSALFVVHAGKLTPFAETLGGSGLMSAVVSGKKLYYTYSWGSGIHRSHLGQLFVTGGKLTFVESGALVDKDCFVKQDGPTLRLEKGDFHTFNTWKPGQKLGDITPTDTGFTVRDETGKEIAKLSGKAKRAEAPKP